MQNNSVKHLPLLNKSHNFSSSGDRFISVASFSDDRILLNRSILAFVSGRCCWWPGRRSFWLFDFFVDGAKSASSTTLAEEVAWPVLQGVVVVAVQLLGTFLFLPSKVVSMSWTERRKEDKEVEATLTRLQTLRKKYQQYALYSVEPLILVKIHLWYLMFTIYGIF